MNLMRLFDTPIKLKGGESVKPSVVTIEAIQKLAETKNIIGKRHMCFLLTLCSLYNNNVSLASRFLLAQPVLGLLVDRRTVQNGDKASDVMSQACQVRFSGVLYLLKSVEANDGKSFNVSMECLEFKPGQDLKIPMSVICK